MKATITYFLLTLVTTQTFAGGPLNVRNEVPVKYSTDTPIEYRTDLGPLGSYNNNVAVDLAVVSFQVWQDVSAAVISFTRNGVLPVDVNGSNYLTYLSGGNGFSPIVFDSDGSIIDQVLGAGASNSIIGFAGSFSSGGLYTEGQAVMNGKFSNTFTPEQFKATFIHEFGHLIGLDHTQIHVNLANNGNDLDDIYIPTMYPFSVDNDTALATLNIDDIIDVTSLYPAPTFAANAGISGAVTRFNTSFVRGANVLAIKISDSLMYRVSIVTDYLQLNTGNYSIVGLDPSEYWIKIEPINTSFTGGSRVGPYASSLSDLSFQDPVIAEYYNGPNESSDPSIDNPLARTNVTVLPAAMTTGINLVANLRLPSAPVPVSPLNGESGVSTSPTLSWNPAVDAISYHVQFSQDSLFNTRIVDTTGISTTSFSVTGLTLNTKYFWRVRGQNTIGVGPFSASQGFRTAENLGETSVALRNFNLDGTQHLFVVDSPPFDSGFVFGTNFYDDLTKAAAFTLPQGASQGRLTKVRVWFGYKRVGITNQKYRMQVYGGSASTGPQGLLYSQEYNVASIPVDNVFSPPELPTEHTLAQQVSVPLNFFVAVDFGSYTSADWGMLGIISTFLQAERVAQEWERWSDGSWHNVSDSWFQGGANGWYMWIEPTVIVGTPVNVENLDFPVEFSLSQNFPNPFNPSTTIRFQLSQSGETTLKAFDLLGRQVATLVEGPLDAGRHQVHFNASHLSNGVYYYTLQSGPFRQTRRMILLK